MIRIYPNVLQLRLRMPIDGDLSNPRNFITKIANYAKAWGLKQCPPTQLPL